MHIWTQTHIMNTATFHRSLLWRVSVIFLSQDYSNITACTTPLEVSSADTHTHTHESNNFPPPAACCGSWSVASVNWLNEEREEEEKEEGAAGHEQQRRWRPIGNQCTMSIFAPYGLNTRSDSCHSPLQRAPSHREWECLPCSVYTV